MKLRKLAVALVIGIAVGQAQAVPVDYDIVFTQTWLAHDPAESGYGWLGPRVLTGQMSIDDSVLGPSFANTVYGPYSPELSAIYSYTVTLDSKVYSFDQAYTAQVGSPPLFSTVIRTDSTGSIVGLQGVFKIPNTISSIFLGGNGWEGTYQDVQQVDPYNSVLVSRGTYAISPVAAPVPEPETYAMMLAGLGLLGVMTRPRKQKLNA